MDAFLAWLLEQAPVVIVGGAWIYTLYQDRGYHRDRADKKEEGDKELFERMITAVTESTAVMKEVIDIVKGNRDDHSTIRESVTNMNNKLVTMETKLEIINTKLHG